MPSSLPLIVTSFRLILLAYEIMPIGLALIGNCVLLTLIAGPP